MKRLKLPVIFIQVTLWLLVITIKWGVICKEWKELFRSSGRSQNWGRRSLFHPHVAFHNSYLHFFFFAYVLYYIRPAN